MQLTSRRSSFCDQYWQGGEIYLNVNDIRKATIPSKFSRYEFCLPIEEVNVMYDRFQLQSTNDDAVCISSFQINGTQIFVGPENNQTSFWIDRNQPSCENHKLSTKEITIQNGQVIFSECKG